MVRKPGSKHSVPSSRVTARRNDWNSIRVLHQGPRSKAASRGRIHDRSPIHLPKYQKCSCREGAVHTCEAVGRPTMRFVPVKSVEQQATLAVHGTRALLVRQRTMAANALRAALSEIGIVAAQGLKGLRELMATLEAPSGEIPEMMRGALLVLARHWQTLDADERALERQIAKAARADHEARRLMEVPGV